MRNWVVRCNLAEVLLWLGCSFVQSSDIPEDLDLSVLFVLIENVSFVSGVIMLCSMSEFLFWFG